MTIQTHPAPESAPIVNGTPPAGPVYDWDRTGAEAAEHAKQQLISRSPFPTPKNTTMDFAGLCDYYNALRDLPVGRYAKLYVQRFWPILLPIESVDDFGQAKDSFPNDLIITDKDGEFSQQLLLQLAGVGEYKFRLNDSRRPWKQQTIVFSAIELIDPSFWTLHPPIIDPKRLDLEAKRNQVYIKFARSHGYLPHEGAVEKEEIDMANAEVVTQLLQQNRVLTDQVITKASTPPPAPPVPKVENGNGDGGALKAVADLAIAALNRPQAAAAPASDPMVYVKGVVDMVKSITPAPDHSSADLAKEVVKESAAANERVFKMQESAIEQMRQEIKEARATPVATVAPVVPRTDTEVLQEMVTKQNLLKQLTGRGGTAAAEEESPGKVDKWLEAAQYLGPIAQTFLQGVFQTIQYGVKTWGEVHHNDALGRNGQPSTTMPTETKQPIKPSDPAPSPEQQAQKQQWDAIMQSSFMVVPHMLTSLEADPPESGAEFAAFIIKRGPEKRVSYDKLRSLADALKAIGVQIPGNDIERFIGACRFVFEKMPPPLNRILGIPTVPQFLTDFYNYDQILEQQEG